MRERVKSLVDLDIRSCPLYGVIPPPTNAQSSRNTYKRTKTGTGCKPLLPFTYIHLMSRHKVSPQDLDLRTQVQRRGGKKSMTGVLGNGVNMRKHFTRVNL